MSSVAGGGIGGIIASVSFRSQDAIHGYRPGLWTTVTAQLIICVVSSVLMLHFKRQNTLARLGQKVLEGHPGKSPFNSYRDVRVEDIGFLYTL